MLDLNLAKAVKEALDQHFNGDSPLTFEDVVNMSPISKGGKYASYMIIGSQFGDLTILVWLQFSDNTDVIVRQIKTIAW